MRRFGRWILLCLLALLVLEGFFIGRIALMVALNPGSTTFQRSEAWWLATRGDFHWRQQWRDYDQISDNLKRAVIASEDDSFVNHEGVDWEAVEKAWDRNAKADVVLESPGEVRERVVVSQTATGEVRELQLRMRLRFRLRTPDGRELLPTAEVTRQIDQSYAESAALSKEQETLMLYQNMQSDIVQQLMRRLATVK